MRRNVYLKVPLNMGHTLAKVKVGLDQSQKLGFDGEVLHLLDELVALVTIWKLEELVESAYPCAWLAFIDLFIGC